jgi:hypothetical protein
VKPFENPPPQVQEKLSPMISEAEALLASLQYSQAKIKFREICNLLLESQPPGTRYHKGYVLHQAGVASFLSGETKEALPYFVQAYIEDLLSQDQNQEDKADELPAAENLRNLYHVSEDFLKDLKRCTIDAKKGGYVVRYPLEIIDQLKEKWPPDWLDKHSKIPNASPSKRKPGQFFSDWEKRVFVGGSYSHHLSEINEIKRVCLILGYDPIIAAEFQTPPDRIHHHALMLLHECSKAIFEVTAQAGQLMEIERLRDYQIDPLIIHQERAYRSEMLMTLLTLSVYKVETYNSFNVIETLVTGYLK